MADLDVPPSHPPPPPPPAPKRLSRPKITLQIPLSTVPITPRGPGTGSVYWGPTMYHGKPPGTAATHISDPHNPYFNPFMNMYHNKASDFMFKQFAGFKDFTMNTAKSGLSAGEKSAFWFYNKLRSLSKKWFTHLFLTLCLALYSVMGAGVFMALEGPQEHKMSITKVRKEIVSSLQRIVEDRSLLKNETLEESIERHLLDYASNYTVCTKEFICTDNENISASKTWGFWNAMFYAGTIYTTIGSTHHMTTD